MLTLVGNLHCMAGSTSTSGWFFWVPFFCALACDLAALCQPTPPPSSTFWTVCKEATLIPATLLATVGNGFCFVCNGLGLKCEDVLELLRKTVPNGTIFKFVFNAVFDTQTKNTLIRCCYVLWICFSKSGNSELSTKYFVVGNCLVSCLVLSCLKGDVFVILAVLQWPHFFTFTPGRHRNWLLVFMTWVCWQIVRVQMALLVSEQVAVVPKPRVPRVSYRGGPWNFPPTTLLKFIWLNLAW